MTGLGPVDATDVHVDEQLPKGLKLRSAHPDQGTFGKGSGFWDVGTLAEGDTATLDVVAKVSCAVRTRCFAISRRRLEGPTT